MGGGVGDADVRCRTVLGVFKFGVLVQLVQNAALSRQRSRVQAPYTPLQFKKFVVPLQKIITC